MEKENIKVKKTPKQKVFFGLKIAGNVLFYAIIIGLLLFSIMNIRAGQGYAKGKGDGFPNIFGKGYLSVQTESMTKFDNGYLPDEYNDYAVKQFGPGDLLNVNVFKESDWNNLKKGDVITYYDTSLQALNSHRIVYIYYDTDANGNKTINSICLQGDLSASGTRGVFNPDDATRKEYDNDLVERREIENIYKADMGRIKGVCTSVSYGAGKVADNIKQNWLLYFVVPVGIFLLVEIFFVVKNIMDLRGAKAKIELDADKAKMSAELEAQREEMRKQILAELAANQNNNEKVEEEKDPFEAYSEKKKEEE